MTKKLLSHAIRHMWRAWLENLELIEIFAKQAKELGYNPTRANALIRRLHGLGYTRSFSVLKKDLKDLHAWLEEQDTKR